MNKKEYKQQNEAYIAQIAQQKGIKSLPANIYYEELAKGNGPKPNSRSLVTVYYKGSLINGSVFDGNTRQGYPDAFRLTDLIGGWQVALTQMNVGSKWRIYIPANMGYGKLSQPGIPVHSTLVFEIELVGIG